MYKYREAEHSTQAPDIVVPIILNLFKVNNVLDVGCGTGTWLKVFKRHGINEILGIDGHYVDQSKLYIDSKYFKAIDLREGFELGRKYDLALCLEVAEHLPESSANNLVRSLVHHSDIIIFSAAIPGQGGQDHINEQWPSYWQKLFLEFGFFYYDMIRPKIWTDERVNIWYRQNIFVVAKKGVLSEVPDDEISNLVHPELWLRKTVNRKRISNTINRWRNWFRKR